MVRLYGKSLTSDKNNDPTCDVDLDAADRIGEFRVVACVNTTDATLANCTPLGTPPIDPSGTNLCNAPFAIRVTLRGTTRLSKGHAFLRTVTPSLLSVPRLTTDRDRVTLVCAP